MGQIPYTLRFKLGKPDKNNECRVYLRYYSDENDLLLPTAIRVAKKYFDATKIDNPIVRHPNSKAFNVSLQNLKIEVNNRAVQSRVDISKDYLLGKSAGSNSSIPEFIEKLINLMSTKGGEFSGTLSKGRLIIYNVLKGKIERFDRNAKFSSVNLEWMLRLEKSIRDSGVSPNTLCANMSGIKALLNRAESFGLIDKKQYERYKVPRSGYDIPIYLEENEINDIFDVCRTIKDEVKKTCGYYFLLSCYTGYRMSDLISFDYKKRVKQKTIAIRARKNGTIVSIYIHSKLREVLNYCKAHRIAISEQKFRIQVKSICKLAGVENWGSIKVHSARHSFAMLMLEKGLDKFEVAELLGDTLEVAERYARISNKHLERKVKNAFE